MLNSTLGTIILESALAKVGLLPDSCEHYSGTDYLVADFIREQRALSAAKMLDGATIELPDPEVTELAFIIPKVVPVQAPVDEDEEEAPRPRTAKREGSAGSNLLDPITNRSSSKAAAAKRPPTPQPAFQPRPRVEGPAFAGHIGGRPTDGDNFLDPTDTRFDDAMIIEQNPERPLT